MKADNRSRLSATIAAVIIVVMSACGTNAISGPAHSVQVPSVKDQSPADAIATLQNMGFRTRTLHRPDSTVAPDHVIGTDPNAGQAAEQGSEVTISVSTGPEQRQVPDVSTLSFADAENRLTAAGFGTLKQVPTPSTTEQKGRVLGTNPPANQTAPVTSEISVLVGSGPDR
jgi:eukaryotic-like serine/threonine-protein kinase